MNIDNLTKHIEWEEYYDPNFDWKREAFYINNSLSDEFLEEFKDKVNWLYVSISQKLSESTIEKFSDKVDWYWICSKQTLSEDFIIKHKEDVFWYNILIYQKLSPEFKTELAKKTDETLIDYINSMHINAMPQIHS